MYTRGRQQCTDWTQFNNLQQFSNLHPFHHTTTPAPPADTQHLASPSPAPQLCMRLCLDPGRSVTLSTYLRGVIHSRVLGVLVSPDMMTSPGKQRQILLIQHPTRCRCLALLCTHAARHKAPVFSALFIELNFRKFQSLETWSS